MVQTLAKPRADMWQERSVIHKFADGWTIEWLRKAQDLKRENQLLFGNRACLADNHWPRWVDDNGYLLLSLREPKGMPKATILLGNAMFVMVNRFYRAHPGYTMERIFDQRPRMLENRRVIALQCCPSGFPNSDVKMTRGETLRVQKWYENLPISQRKAGGEVAGV